MIRRILSYFIIITFVILIPELSFSTTECTGKITRIWTGDEGIVWLVFDNGINAYAGQNDPDTKNILAMTSIALVTNKSVTIRFEADSVPCDGSTNPRNDIVGVWLVN